MTFFTSSLHAESADMEITSEENLAEVEVAARVAADTTLDTLVVATALATATAPGFVELAAAIDATAVPTLEKSIPLSDHLLADTVAAAAHKDGKIMLSRYDIFL
ncbi:MAG: hypothetical protein ACPGVT_11440 [Maricaulaceae bacterium]